LFSISRRIRISKLRKLRILWPGRSSVLGLKISGWGGILKFKSSGFLELVWLIVSKLELLAWFIWGG
jgi:hypothetical protein